jgi:type II secretory pathway component GspD/PulD (secretin)
MTQKGEMCLTGPKKGVLDSRAVWRSKIMRDEPSYIAKGISNFSLVRSLVFILVASFLLGPPAADYLSAAESRAEHPVGSLQNAKAGGDCEPARYRVFSLRHISAQKGKEFLAEAKIGTVSKLPGANMLLVTAQPQQLIKASAILKLVDVEEEFAIRTISPAPSVRDYRSNEQIAARLKGRGEISIGTLSGPPVGAAHGRAAIIDVHNDALIVVAPANLLEGILSAIGRAPALQEDSETGTEQLQHKTVDSQTPPPAEPDVLSEPDKTRTIELEVKPATEVEHKLLEEIAVSGELAGQTDVDESGSDELFNELLKSLAEAEKRASEQTRQPEETGEPNAVEAVQEANLPSKPSADSEPAQERTGQPPQVELTDILKRLEALEAGLKAAPEPKPEPVVEEEAVKVEEPNEADALASEKRVAEPAVEANEPAVEANEPAVEVNEPAVEVNEPVVEEPAARVEQPNEVAEPVPQLWYAPEPLPNGEDVLKLDLPEKIPITEFLSFVGEHLKLDYLYDPIKVKGEVTLRLQGKLRGPIKVKDLYPLLESVMQFHGFAMTRKDNLVTIRLMSEADLIDPPIVLAAEDKLKPGNVIITRVFELKHIDPTSAQNLVTGMKLGVAVRPIPEAGMLIVTGYAYRMTRVQQLIEMIDKPGEPRKFRFRQLRYTMAETLAPKIQTLVEQLAEVTVTIAQPTAAAPQQPKPAPGRPRPRGRPPARAPAAKPAAPQPSQQPTIYLDFDERTNRVLMIGLEEQLDLVDELIDTLDVVQQDLRALRLYEIQHVDAEEVRKKLGELGIISAEATTARGAPGRITRARQPAQAAKTPRPTVAGATEEASTEEPQVVIIETINSLLVNATPEQHAQIAMIIGYVDTETKETDIPYVVYPLENQDPEELATVLNQLIEETTTRQEKDAKIIEKTKKTEEEITIIADKNTFSLIVYASKKNQQWIESLIKQLDKRRPQVLIDVTLVQIVKDDAFNMDLDLLTSIPDLTYTSTLTGGFASAIEGKSVLDLLLAPESDRSRFIDASSIGSSFTGFFGDEKINALLTAVQTKNYGRIMARPKLLVNDNELGTIKTTDTTYVTRTSTNIIGTETPQTATQTVFDDYSAGITLEITPHISEGDMLRLEILLNRSGFTSKITEEITKPPNKSDADISTVVTVPNRSTIILGGMEKVEDSKGGQKIPILGDIPIIGGAFRSVARASGQDKLYVFVKAHILRPGGDLALADLKQVSRENRERFERLEKEMGEYEDWPGIKPKPLDPVRILEAD